MSITCKSPIFPNTYPSPTQITYVKGSLDKIISLSSTYFTTLKESPLILSESVKVTLRESASRVMKDGLRVLALAYSTSSSISNSTSISPSSGFCLVGFVGMYDPPRAGISKVIQTLKNGGVRVVMITGDAGMKFCAQAIFLSFFNGKILIGDY